MLNDSGLVADLLSAYAQTTWLAYGQGLATAISTYVLSGSVQTEVSGVASGPNGPYPVSGSGLGQAVPAGFAPFQQALIAASTTSTLWKTFSNSLTSAIGAFIDSSVVSTVVGEGCVGAGVGTISSAPGLSAFSTTCETIFMTSQNNSQLVLDFKDALKALLLASVVITVDSGPSPHPWTGGGSGGIV